MGLLQSVGRIFAARRTAPNQEFSSERIMWLPSREMGGIRMSQDDALRLSAVWACVTVTAKALAACNVDVYSEQENGDRLPRHRLSAYALLNSRPNPEMTAFGFKEAMYITAQIYGNFYAEIEWDMGNRPVALWPIDPSRATLEREPDGRLVLVVRNHGRPDTVMDYTDVLHIHGPGVDGLSGFDVVTMAARSLAHAAAAEKFGAAFYHNNTQIGGLLSFDQKIPPEDVPNIQKAIEEGRRGSGNAWKLLVMDRGPKYESFGTDPDKAQFVETRHLMIEEVCRWFGVPPHKIAHLLRATFNNIEHLGIEFVRDALTPWAERFAQECDYKLLNPWVGIFCRVDLEWLQEGDAKSKAETDAILVANGIINRNEARRRRGYNTIGPDGDKFTAQINLTTLEKLGADPVVPEEPEGAATQALFRMAMLRSQTRRARVADQARAAGADVRDALDADFAEHSRYVGHAIAQAVATLRLDVDQDAVAAVLSRRIAEESEFLVEGPYNVSLRADEAAAELAALVRTTGPA